MSILRKPLEQLAVADLHALVEAQARETAELEFKGDLPFQSQKGLQQQADRWIEKGDRVGDYARDRLLAELIAFANADGGTLIIGLHETKEEPRTAERLEPLPNCEGLARRLLDATEDVIEPRISAIQARALAIDDQGAGYVIMRVGKSLSGPHRLTTTREFYIRRGERAARMNVREIKDLTLELARTGDLLERAFQERHEAAKREFDGLQMQEDRGGPGALAVRATAMPTTIQHIPELTRRGDLWWTGQGFTMKVGENDYDCPYPAREFYQTPRIQLRSMVFAPDRSEGGPHRLLRADGAIEFRLVHPKREKYSSAGHNRSTLYVSWLLSLVVGTIAQIEHLRQNLAWDSVAYGLEIEIFSEPPLVFRWSDSLMHSGAKIENSLPLRLPSYSVDAGTANFDALVTSILEDVFNACGSVWRSQCSVPWDSLAVRK